MNRLLYPGLVIALLFVGCEDSSTTGPNKPGNYKLFVHNYTTRSVMIEYENQSTEDILIPWPYPSYHLEQTILNAGETISLDIYFDDWGGSQLTATENGNEKIYTVSVEEHWLSIQPSDFTDQ